MNSTAASNFSSRLSDLLQHVDAVQAAAQISRLATDLACAFGCVRFVLGELSTCQRPDKLLYLIDLLYRLSLLSNVFVTEALQRLQTQVIQALQISVPYIPEHQQKQLDALRQSWLKAEQTRSRSGQLNLQDIASWLSGAGRKDDHPKEQTSHADAPARSAQVSPPAPETHSLPAPPSLHLPPPPIRHTVPAAIPPHPMTKPPPPVHSNQPRRHESSNMPACGPTQQRQSNRKSQWDVPPNPVENTWNSQPHGQQPEQHAARQSVHSRDASPEQLAQRLKGFSLQPADLAGTSTGRQQASTQPGSVQASQPVPQTAAATLQPDQDKSGNQFAWVATADLRQVRQRLGELRRMRTLLHQEERLLHMRRQELDPASGRPLKIFCWCGKELWKWVLGDTYCGRERPGEPRGHKLCITFMQCTGCKCKKTIAVDAPADGCWCPKHWQCPGCCKELHGATCSKAGSNIVAVH